MLPAPPEVRCCPACGGRFLHPMIASGNNFGARLWSDGYYDAPMLPSPPPFVFTPCCSRVVALRDARRLGRFDPKSPEARDSGLEVWKVPSLRQLLAALDEVREPRERRGTLLEQLWLRANDRRRRNRSGPLRGIPGPVAAALEEFFELTDPDLPAHRLGRAELCRELGRFDEALEILAEPLDDDWEPLACQVRAWASAHNPRLEVFET